MRKFLLVALFVFLVGTAQARIELFLQEDSPTACGANCWVWTYDGELTTGSVLTTQNLENPPGGEVTTQGTFVMLIDFPGYIDGTIGYNPAAGFNAGDFAFHVHPTGHLPVGVEVNDGPEMNLAWHWVRQGPDYINNSGAAVSLGQFFAHSTQGPPPILNVVKASQDVAYATYQEGDIVARGDNDSTYGPSPTVIPEPATLAFVGAGLLAVGLLRKRIA